MPLNITRSIQAFIMMCTLSSTPFATWASPNSTGQTEIDETTEKAEENPEPEGEDGAEKKETANSSEPSADVESADAESEQLKEPEPETSESPQEESAPELAGDDVNADSEDQKTDVRPKAASEDSSPQRKAEMVTPRVTTKLPQTTTSVAEESPTAMTSNPATALASLEPGKSGLWGWGLGVELPMGVLAGTATSSSHGVGYTMGVVMSLEIIRGWSVRLGLSGGETSRGKATIQYLEGGIPLTKSFEAEWLGVELGLGVQYTDKEFDDLLWPYLGFEAGPTFAGYYYRFDSATVSTLATNDETTRYGANEYEAVGLGWAARLRGGIRIELTPGMEWGTEYSLSMTTVSENEPVTNTRQIREVFPIQEFIFQHRLVISLWVGL